jgi:ABC-2 type transport system permease protein
MTATMTATMPRTLTPPTTPRALRTRQASSAARTSRPALTAVLRSEWTKARTVRSTAWTLALTVVVSVGVGLLDSFSVHAAIARHSALVRPDFSAADAGFVGIGLGHLCLVVFAVLLAAAEYTTGSILGSLTAVPVRWRFYAGKLLVVAGMAFAVALAATAVSFSASERALGTLGVPLRSPGVPRAILGAAAYTALICVFSAAVAFMLRSSALALGILLPFHFVLPTILTNVPGLKTLAACLPDPAGAQAMQVVRQGSSPLTPGSGLLVLAAWTAAAVLGGYACLRARDA